jgi:hypothetical protein
MKLTKQKLEQLIMEELKTMSQKIFDKRRKHSEVGLVRVHGDEGQPINYPELADKLRTLYTADPESRAQAIELADSLGEPIDTEQDPDNIEIIPLAPEKLYNPRTSGGKNVFGTKPEHWKYGTWYHYVRKGYTTYFEDEIDEDTFERYVEYGEDHGHLSDPATPKEKQNLRKKLEAERDDINSKFYIDRRRPNFRRTKIQTHTSK